MSNEAGPIWTIIVAAGSGSRFGGSSPKQFVEIADRRVIDWSVAVAAEVSDGIVIVLPRSGNDSSAVLSERPLTEMRIAVGGETRSESVRNGLAEVPADAGVVLVHDAARPAASLGLFRRVLEAVRRGAEAVVPVVGVVDTMRHVDGEPVDRAKLQVVQTPQGFDATTLRRAYATQTEATDDATLVAAAGGQITTVEGERWNIKLTQPEDEVVIAALLLEPGR